jgi:uncharacterized protein (DUF2235 family)
VHYQLPITGGQALAGVVVLTMSKNIVICCDGTGNDFCNLALDSNVAKLYSALTINDMQIAYYHPGVGTMGDPTIHSKVGRQISRLKGLAFGQGLMANVGDAYRYLMDHYVDGDKIYLIGFSRGAFTARALASLIHVYGLLCAGNHEAIPYILSMYAAKTKAMRSNHPESASLGVEDGFQWQFSHSVPVMIHFAGMWDTVSSYGWVYDPIELPFLGINPIIEIGRHAVSIDERRCFYQDNLWGDPPKGNQGPPLQDIKQVWFRGVHSDVGGSYEETESGLSKITLEWMLVEASKAGLLLDGPKAETVLGRANAYPQLKNLPNYVPPDPQADLHVSLKKWWWLPEYFLQHDPHLGKKGLYFPRGRMRTIPPGSWIHESVFKRKSVMSGLPSHEMEPWIAYEPCFTKDVRSA